MKVLVYLTPEYLKFYFKYLDSSPKMYGRPELTKYNIDDKRMFQSYIAT